MVSSNLPLNNAPLPCPVVSIVDEHADLFKSINTFVHTYMSKYDNSHDYQHILRVLSNTNRIYLAEIKANPSVTYNTTALFLAALLHDVGDHKYAKPGEDIENQIKNTLLERGASAELAQTVQTIVKHVSYTNEIRNPESVTAVISNYPELAIIQDADRLDAIGAIGIGRCFSFGAAKFPNQPMTRAIDHFEEKLVRLEGMMKTETGKAMARRRTRVLEEFQAEWKEEASLSFGFE